MNAERIREEFESLAERLGYTVRYEKGNFRGDACRVNEDRLIILNRQIPVEHQNYAYSRIFAREDLQAVSVLPVLRDMILEAIGGEVEAELPESDAQD